MHCTRQDIAKQTERGKGMSLIEEILRSARAAGASDVHLTVGIPPKMRVNGNLITMNFPKLFPKDTLDVVIGIMTEGQRERFEEQGEYDMSFSIPDCGRFRLNAYKQRGTAALAFRVVDDRIPSLEELGVPDSVAGICHKKHGLVLVTGSAGSGKSTTLAAIIDRINSSNEMHIITMEDPIEYLHQHKLSMVNQREIGLDTDNYANALRAALREDPDVILVGELRDTETIRVAITAAEAGHLVLSTLQTVGVASSVDRIMDMFPTHQQIQIRMQFANVVETIVSQQLLPTVDKGERVAAFEVLQAGNTVRNLIREGRSYQLNDVIKQKGMLTMDEAIVMLYSQGKISRETALAYAKDPDEVDNNL